MAFKQSISCAIPKNWWSPPSTNSPAPTLFSLVERREVLPEIPSGISAQSPLGIAIGRANARICKLGELVILEGACGCIPRGFLEVYKRLLGLSALLQRASPLQSIGLPPNVPPWVLRTFGPQAFCYPLFQSLKQDILDQTLQITSTLMKTTVLHILNIMRYQVIIMRMFLIIMTYRITFLFNSVRNRFPFKANHH